MFDTANSLYIEDISIEKDYNVNSPNQYILMKGCVYFEVPQWKGFGYNFTFECKGYSRHLSKDLFFIEAINDAFRNLYNGVYEETDLNTTGRPGTPNIVNRIHKIDTNLIEEFDVFIKDLFSKSYCDKDISLG